MCVPTALSLHATGRAEVVAREDNAARFAFDVQEQRRGDGSRSADERAEDIAEPDDGTGGRGAAGLEAVEDDVGKIVEGQSGASVGLVPGDFDIAEGDGVG